MHFIEAFSTKDERTSEIWNARSALRWQEKRVLGGRRAHCGARDAQHLLPSLLRRYAKRGRSCFVDPLGMGGQVGDNPNFGRSVLGRSVRPHTSSVLCCIDADLCY